MWSENKNIQYIIDRDANISKSNEDCKSTTEKLKKADFLDSEVPGGVVKDMKRMVVHCTDAVVRNIDDRFKESLAEVTALSIFDSL